MKNKIYAFLLFSLVAFFSPIVYGQSTGLAIKINRQPPLADTLCQQFNYRITVKNTTSAPIAVRLKLTLLSSVVFAVDSNASGFSITDSNGIQRLRLPALAAGDSALLYYNLTPSCRAIPTQSLSGNPTTITHRISLDSLQTASFVTPDSAFSGNIATINAAAYYYYFSAATPSTQTVALASAVDAFGNIAFQNNSPSTAFNGKITVAFSFSCASNYLKNIQLRYFTDTNQITTVNGSLQNSVYTFNQLNIPAGAKVRIVPVFYSLNCLTANCSYTFRLAHGCNSSSADSCLLRNSSNQNFTINVVPSNDMPGVNISRILPVPYGNCSGLIWDNQCMNDSTVWEYVVENKVPAGSTGVIAKNVVVRFFRDAAAANQYTNILRNSISVNGNNSYGIADTIAHRLSIQNLDVNTFFSNAASLPACAQQAGNPLVSSFTDTIPVLLPGQRVLIRFATVRCCPSGIRFGSAVNFNFWRNEVQFQYDCQSSSVTLNAAKRNSSSVFNTNSNAVQNTYATESFINPGARKDDVTGGTKPDYNPKQQFQQTILDITGGKGTVSVPACSPAVQQLIKNLTFFSSDNNISDANADFYTDGLSVTPSTCDPYGLNPRGRIIMRFEPDSNLLLSGVPQLMNGNSNNSLTAVNATVASNGNVTTATFTISGNTTTELRNFLIGSSLVFNIQGCCPADNNPNPGMGVKVYFVPEIQGKNCAECLMPIDSHRLRFQIHCPGCVTPGGIIRSASMERLRFGFSDLDDDGLPDKVGNYLQPIDASYAAFSLINRYGSVQGDTLVNRVRAYLQDGDPQNGFTIAQWQNYWGDSARLDHLYLETLFDPAQSTLVQPIRVRAVYFPASGGGQPVSILLSDTAVKNLSNARLLHLQAGDFGAGVHFNANDSFHLYTYYTSCHANFSSKQNLTLNQKVYFTTTPLSGYGSQAPTKVFAEGGDYFKPIKRYCDSLNLSPYAAQVNPVPPVLYVCEGFACTHGIYALKHQYQESWNDQPGCNKALSVRLKYYLEDKENASGNFFPFEYLPLHGVNTAGRNSFARGPLVAGDSGIAYIIRHIKNQQDSINYVLKPESVILQASSFNPKTAPTFVVTGINNLNDNSLQRILQFTDTAKSVFRLHTQTGSGSTGMVYEPPYDGSNDFIANQANTQVTTQQVVGTFGKPALLPGDEYFDQTIQFTVEPICSLQTADATIVKPNDVTTLAPSKNNAACQTQADTLKLIGSSTADTLHNPNPNIQVQNVNYQFKGNQVWCHFGMKIVPPANRNPYIENLFYYIDVPKEIAPNNVNYVTLAGMSEVKNNGQTDTLARVANLPPGATYNRYIVPGRLNDTLRTFRVLLNITNCDYLTNPQLVADSFRLPVHYFWSCDTVLAAESLPPQPPYCAAPDTIFFSVKMPGVLLNTASTTVNKTTYKTCEAITYSTQIVNFNAGGLEDFTDSLVIPKSFNLSNVVLRCGSDSVLLSAAALSALPHPTDTNLRIWKINSGSATAFVSSNTVFADSNGLSNNKILRLRFTLTARCNTTATLPRVRLWWDARLYCGSRLSELVQAGKLSNLPTVVFDSVTFNGNGCGPYLSLKDTCNGKLLYSHQNGFASPPFVYTWSGSGTLPPSPVSVTGTYAVTVTDSLGCFETKTATVDTALSLSLDSVTHIRCFGNATGSIKVKAAGGKKPYAFLWSNGATTQNLSNLTAGTYILTLTDSKGCTAKLTQTVAQPAAALSLSSTVSNTCVSGTNNVGSITITASGGTAPYTYLWNNGTTSPTRTGLGRGFYTITVTDMNGCTASRGDSVRNNVPNPSFNITPSGLVIKCSGDTVTAKAVSVSNCANCTYQWSTGTLTSSADSIRFSRLNQGTTELWVTVTATLTNANGCSTTQSQNIRFDPYPADAGIIVTPNDTICAGDTVTLQGYGSNLYNWSTNANTATIKLTPATTTTYTLSVTNSNYRYCPVVVSKTITVLPAPAATVTLLDTCAANPKLRLDSAAANISGFRWQKPNGSLVNNRIVTIDTPGTYRGTMFYANGCSRTVNYTTTSLNGGLVVGTGAPSQMSGKEKLSTYLNAGMLPASGVQNQRLIVAGTFEIDTNYTFGAGSRFTCLPGASIKVMPGKTLTLSGSSSSRIILSTCDTILWRGIELAAAVMGMFGQVQTAGGSLSMNFTNLSDALYGVQLRSGSSYGITNTNFINNFIGLAGAGSVQLSFFGININATAAFTGNVFASTGNVLKRPFANMPSLGSGISLPAPQAATRGYAGVYLSNLGTFTAGASGSARDSFAWLHNGIITYNMNLSVTNSIFDSMKLHNYSTGSAPLGYGVYASGITLGTAGEPQYPISSLSVTGLGNAANSRAVFNGCVYGVLANTVNTEVKQCRFRNMVQYGVQVQNNSYGSTRVNNNRIAAGWYGISYLANDPYIQQEANDNHITVSGIAPTYHGMGIYVGESGQLPVDGMTGLYMNDTIIVQTYARHGMFFQGAAGFLISGDTIQLNTTAAQAKAGIYVGGCSGYEIYGNRIRGSSTTTANDTILPAAIFNDASTTGRICGNSTQNTYTGLLFKGTSTETKIITNQIRTHSYGLWVRDGAISPQGVDSANHRNQWTAASYPQRAALHYSQNLAQFQRIYYPANVAQGSVFYPNNILPVNWFSPSFKGTLCCPVLCREGDSIGELNGLESAIVNSELQFGEFEAEQVWQNEQVLFEKMRADETLQTADAAAAAFYSTKRGGSMGSYAVQKEQLAIFDTTDTNIPEAAFYQRLNQTLLLESRMADSLLAAAVRDTVIDSSEVTIIDSALLQNALQWKMYATAQHSQAQAGAADAFGSLHQNRTTLATEVSAINNAVQTDGFVAENEKLYNSIYQQTKMQGRTDYTAEEWAAIEYLAFQCPLKGGKPVYLARTLYRLQKDTVFEDANLCAVQQIAYKRDNRDTVQIVAAVAEKEDRKQPKVKIYPNPATHQIVIEIEGEIAGEIVDVCLYDALGKVLMKNTLKYSDGQANKTLFLNEFVNGIYYVSVRDEEKSLLNSKLIIAK